MIDKARQWALLEEIGFTRVGGTAEELRAAKIIKKHVEAAGVKAEIIPYKVNAWDVKKVSLKTANHEYDAAAFGMCGSTPEEGITAGFYYMEQQSEVEKVLAKGKIVLINSSLLTKETLKFVLEAKAAGVICFCGDLRDRYEDTDLLYWRELLDSELKIGKIPTVMIRVHDAFDLVMENPESITMTVIQEEGTADSHNVIAEIKGTEYPDEIIAFSAHYDSVEYSKGVYDNAAGSVILTELLHHFKENQPKRTLRFIWTGCEERGLLGAYAYVNEQAEDLKNIRFLINVDVGGPVLGKERVSVMADQSAVHYVENLAKEIGVSCAVKQDIYSGDCLSFGEKGISSVTFDRGGIPGTSYIHSRHDTLMFMSPSAMEKTTQFVLKFTERVVNSAVFPIDREVPEVIMKKIEEYHEKLI